MAFKFKTMLVIEFYIELRLLDFLHLKFIFLINHFILSLKFMAAEK